MKFCVISGLSLLLLTTSVVAQPKFPKLTGRVVDNANIINADIESRLSSALQAHELATGNQIVIATIKSLEGNEVRDYGYQLGRHWKLGQKGKDNGVILLVAPSDRKVAIEVGYGLEGLLTDAINHNIIQTQLLPAFRQQQFSQGIAAATKAMIDALGGQYKMVTRTQSRRAERKGNNWLSLLFFGIFALQFIGGVGGRRRRGRRGLFFVGGIPTSRSSGFGGGGFGGGFSGGGGSFGGGGASGGW